MGNSFCRRSLPAYWYVIVVLVDAKRTKKRHRSFRLGLWLIASVLLVAGNLVASEFLILDYPDPADVPAAKAAELKRSYLIGWNMTQQAQSYRDITTPTPSDASILYHFGSNPRMVWSKESVMGAKLTLLGLYFVGLFVLTWTVVRATDLSKPQRRKTARKRTAKAPNNT